MRVGSPVLATVAVVVAAVLSVVGYESIASSTSPTLSPFGASPLGEPPHGRLPRSHQGGLSQADGVLPDDVSVFEDQYPAVARLDPDLLAALRRAATDAAGDGIELHVNSGWRSARYQEQLLRDAVAEYGSAEEAARWVATPDKSEHVSGRAVDLGPSDATDWLSDHGAAYGLCQTYDDEPWHYELRPEAADNGCPDRYADPTHDPRMVS